MTRFATISERFRTIACELGLDFGYAPFRKGKEPKVPYIAFSYPERKDFSSDNGSYVRISRIRLLLVTANKNIGLEEAVEDGLEDLGIGFSKTEEYYSDEDVFVLIYETEELIDG